MATNTPTYSFLKPTVGGDTSVWGGYLNTNFDDIDGLLDGTSPVTGIDINGGSIDGTLIGAAVASTGAFTTVNSSGLTTVASLLATTADINGGTIDNTVIGGTTTAAGNFTDVGFNGTMVAEIGTAAAPQYSFRLDTDTGIYRQSGVGDEIGIATGGVARMVLNNSDITVSEPIHAANGTDAAVAYGFTGQTATGMYRESGTGYLNFSVGGNEGLSLESLAARFAQNVVTPKVVLSDGSQAGPSITYGSDTDTGFFRESANTVGYAGGGGCNLRLNNAYLSAGTSNTTGNPQLVAAELGAVVHRDGVFRAQCSSSASLDLSRATSVGTIAIWRYQQSVVGTVSVTGSNTAYNTSSDYRLKENITPVQGAVELVRALNPVTYTAIADGQWYDGFLAHEVQGIIPTAVQGELDGTKEEEYEITPADGDTPAVMGTRTVPDMQSMDYGKLTPILTAGLQAALDKIDALEARIAALETA
jgi:hypothetical protein